MELLMDWNLYKDTFLLATHNDNFQVLQILVSPLMAAYCTPPSAGGELRTTLV